MDFRFTDEQEMFRKSVNAFVEKEVIPVAKELDEKAEFPLALFKRMAELGYFGLRHEEKYGGLNADMITYCIFIEELARGSLSIAATAAMQSLMGTFFISRFGTEEQKEHLLIPAIKGEKIAAFSVTEPNAGSDISAIETTAKREGEYYILNGTKTWLTNATVADFVTVAAMRDKSLGMKGIDLFLVEKGIEGFITGKKIDKLGAKASDTGEVVFDNCRVPQSNLMGGKEGEGFKFLRSVLNEARTMTGAMSLGVARAAFEASLRYSRERIQFGKPIGKFQAIEFKLADMATEIEATKFLVYNAAWLIDKNAPAFKESAMAKLYASEMANKVVDEAIRIFGSYGIAMEYSVQRFFRDARFVLYGGGTSEILRGIIAGELEK